MKNIVTFTFLFIASFTAHAEIPCVQGKGEKCVELSGTGKPQNCTPKESNDCLLKDATVVKGDEIALLWQGIVIKSTQLPENSWYKVEKSTDQEYTLVIYPDVGKHYILGHHDFEIFVVIRKTLRSPTSFTCIKIEKSEDSLVHKFTNGPYDIEIKSSLNYFYHGGPGSNPNPYTREVKEILKTVLENIRVGKC